MMMIRAIIVFLLIVLGFISNAQRKKGKNLSISGATVTQKDTLKLNGYPLPYRDVITDKAITGSGLFIVHKVGEKYYFEIPDSILNRDMLVVSRIVKAAADMRGKDGLGFAGDLIGENVIRFERGPGNKLFIKNISYRERSMDSTDNGMYKSVLNSNLQPIIGSFNIKTLSPDSTGVVIDVTDFINSDNSLLYFGELKPNLYLGTLQTDKSFIGDVRAFPLNVEVKTIKTYSIANGIGFVTYELNSSFVLLPKIPMKTRFSDDRVGFFEVSYRDFDSNPQGVKKTSLITRWRLEPKDEDIDKIKNGILVEPKKPIVFYIDPSTPQKWVPYLIQGVNDWQKAFEKAGFKNAIYAIEVPKGDSTWSLEDARHNAIVYKPSEMSNASGPHIHDPRTGEILETHVNWYHNVMKLLRDWYFIQAGAIDARARKMKFEDSLMGRLIRYVASHEVGHTLGLRHNFGASSTVPVENLRNKRWVEENGHTPSIMDYARFNYAAQPEDSISEAGIIPRIGPYDEWAIEWGYKWISNFNSQDEERNFYNKWIITRTQNDTRLWYGNEGALNDPRCQSEDLGNDALKASKLGIKNLKRIVDNLIDWTYEPGEGYKELENMYNELVDQYKRYLRHVSVNIGGIFYTAKTREQDGKLFEFPGKEKQKAAVSFLHDELFITPHWLIKPKLFSLMGGQGYFAILKVQKSVLSTLINHVVFFNLLYFETNDPKNAYTINELLNDLKNGIWDELKSHKPIDIYRRGVQNAYIAQLISFVTLSNYDTSNSIVRVYSSDLGVSGVLGVVKYHMRELNSAIEIALKNCNDFQTKIHLRECSNRLKEGLKLAK